MVWTFFLLKIDEFIFEPQLCYLLYSINMNKNSVHQTTIRVDSNAILIEILPVSIANFWNKLTKYLIVFASGARVFSNDNLQASCN
jgi:hypothetical protein